MPAVGRRPRLLVGMGMHSAHPNARGPDHTPPQGSHGLIAPAKPWITASPPFLHDQRHPQSHAKRPPMLKPPKAAQGKSSAAERFRSGGSFHMRRMSIAAKARALGSPGAQRQLCCQWMHLHILDWWRRWPFSARQVHGGDLATCGVRPACIG